ncbi:MAG: arsenate reductase ArsC [Candidatus Aminicenantia bacterium]
MAKNILFVCIENSCRSQMAEAFARFYGKGKIEAYSAGSKPASKVDELAILVMKERGIDISHQKSKSFDNLPAEKFDIVVSMGCGEQCPFVPAKIRLEWDIPDSKGKSIDFFRKVRDEIERKIIALLQNISH